MQSRHRGAVVNISSLAALFSIPYLEDYSASKAQLSAYTRSLMASHRDTGVIFIDFQPGDYRTQFNHNLTRYGEDNPESEAVWRQLERNLRRGPAPERAAIDVVAALLRGKSSTVTSGSFFQSKVAPIGRRILPAGLIAWAIRKYYRI